MPGSRLTLAVLSLALAGGGYQAISSLAPNRRPEHLARLAPPETAVRLYSRAVAREPSFAYHWSDLGDAYAGAGDLPRARACFWRALEISGEVPQLWLRDANFHMGLGEADAALASAARVLRKIPDYDGVLFSYFDRLELSPGRVLDRIGSDRRPARAYTEFLIANQRIAPASEAWAYLSRLGHLDDRLTSAFVDALLREGRYQQASASWAAYLDSRRRDYPGRNLLFNGGFEEEPTGCALDWRIQPHQGVEVERDGAERRSGSRSLRLRFPGNDNLSYDNIVQSVPLGPGNYLISFWIKTSEITTNEGPRIEVSDARNPGRLAVASEGFTGARDWSKVEIPFAVAPATQLVSVRLTRRPSRKFDNKIAGTLWMDDFRLARAQY